MPLIKNMPDFSPLLYLAIMLFAGLLFGRLAKLCKLPNVTGYIVGGLLLGPSVLGVIPENMLSGLEVISEIALAFIAFTIGCSFKASYFRRVGKAPVIIAIFEAMLAVFFVQIVLVLVMVFIQKQPLVQSLKFALVLGAIAAATAPAATIMIIKQYKAHGPVTETLMSVVAIDDAVALVAFGFSVAIAGAIGGDGSSSASAGSTILAILDPILEVLLSVVVGVVCAIILKYVLHHFKKSGNRMIITIGAVFLASAVSELVGASSLLSCMMTGAVFCNISTHSDQIASLADTITPPIFLLFFVLSGAELQLAILPQIGLVGAVYVLLRVAGKMAGASLGAAIAKSDTNIRKYLGPTLIPQAGVAIGLTLVAQEVVPQYADRIRAVVLCATLIYEIVGPAITKISLTKAGEIRE